MQQSKEYLVGCEHDGSYIPADAVLKIIKIAQFDAFREGYYAGNAKCRAHKGSAIMEDIIKEDFEKLTV